MDVATRAWTRESRDLWKRIEGHAFENPGIDLDFTRRLARTLDWPLETARAGIAEYRRFCFLACVSRDGPVTPSEEVDEIWHLHLTYTRDYWDLWCGETLSLRLNHDPTGGGPTEQARYRAQYADTLALYESRFGSPPAAFWPGTNARFAARPRWQMVDRTRSLVLPRPSWRRLRMPGLAGLLAMISTPASAVDTLAGPDAGTWNPLDMPGSTFLLLYVCLVPLAVLVSLLLRDLVRTTGRPADVSDLSPVATACAVGGMARAADTLYLELAARGAARYSDNRVTIGRPPDPLPPELERYRAELWGTSFRKTMIGAFKASTTAEEMLADLCRRNVILCGARRRLTRAAILAPAGLLLLLGLTKIVVGLSRGRPVLFLVLLCVLTAAGLLIAATRERFLTREGAEVFAKLRSQFDRAVRAPRRAEVAFAFALGGAAVLAGTEHAAYGKTVAPHSAGGAATARAAAPPEAEAVAVGVAAAAAAVAADAVVERALQHLSPHRALTRL